MSGGLDDRIDFGRELMRAQTETFTRYFGQVESQWKSDGSRVTEADFAISKAFESELENRFSDDLFLSEELDAASLPIQVSERFAWLVDPIDGTNNFARGIPSCSISVALLEEGRPVYGFIYDHMSRSLIDGGQDKGVFVEGQKRHCLDRPPSPQSIVGGQHCGTGRSAEDDLALQKRFKVRNFGSSAIQLAYVGVGWLDGVIAHRVNTWDIAAGVAMIQAAGWQIRYFDAEPFPLDSFDVSSKPFGYLAAPPSVLESMVEATGR
ncbi:MAG TPA: inositol monophosphatase [Opitutae bacterium]|mgnify:CR=1 FL=1|nr:inositol monophosphatase [Opitutae bacterium]